MFSKKALQIERAFETGSIWEAYVSVMRDDLRDLLFQLSVESEDHSDLVERMIEMVKIEETKEVLPLRPREFDFGKLIEMEMASKVLSFDVMALNLYQSIRNVLQRSDYTSYIAEEDRSDFNSILNRLIADEQRHIKMLGKYMGSIKRIS